MTFHRSDVRVGAWASLAGAGTAEIMARAGADWVVLDAQHGRYDDAAVGSTLLELGTVGVPVFVRVVCDAAAVIGRALDAGATGVIVPMVDSPEQAAHIVDACRYPPAGQRSWGPTTALVGRLAPDAAAANGITLCAVMVETRTGVARVGEIAAVDGVDMVFVGPFDLALAMGVSLDDMLADDGPESPLAVVVQACRDAGIRCGAFAGAPERADRLAEFGFTDIAVMTDAGLLAAGARAEVDRWRTTVAADTAAGY